MTADRSTLIVVNPTSGRGRGLRTADAVARALRARGRSVRVEPTSRTGDAERIASEALRDGEYRPGCVVACGGDGTVQEVANALASFVPPPGESRPVMGLAPAGRCNDFARALGVKRHPATIADILADGVARAIDLGRVNSRYFCTVATIGVDAEVSSFVDNMRLPLTGTIAYLYGALRVLRRYQPKVLRITGDFGVVEKPVFLASSANTSSYGGAIPIAPGALPADGLLELCVIDAVSGFRVLALVASVLRGRHEREPEVRFIRTKQLRIDADEPVELWADGERIGQTPALIEVAPGAVEVMLPAGTSILGQAGETVSARAMGVRAG